MCGIPGGSRADRQSGLAGAPRSDDGHQAGDAEALGHLVQLSLPAQEGRGPGREVVWGGRRRARRGGRGGLEHQLEADPWDGHQVDGGAGVSLQLAAEPVDGVVGGTARDPWGIAEHLHVELVLADRSSRMGGEVPQQGELVRRQAEGLVGADDLGGREIDETRLELDAVGHVGSIAPAAQQRSRGPDALGRR